MDGSVASKSLLTEESVEESATEPEVDSIEQEANETNEDVPEENDEDEDEDEDEDYDDDDFEEIGLEDLSSHNAGNSFFPDNPNKEDEEYDEEDDQVLLTRAHQEDLLQGPVASAEDDMSTATSTTLGGSTAGKSEVAMLKTDNDLLRKTLEDIKSQLRQSLTDQAMGDVASRPSAAVGRGRRGAPPASASTSAPVAWPSPRKPKSSSLVQAHASSSRPKDDFMLSRSSLDHELKVVLKRARQYAQSNIKLRQRLDQVSDDRNVVDLEEKVELLAQNLKAKSDEVKQLHEARRAKGKHAVGDSKDGGALAAARSDLKVKESAIVEKNMQIAVLQKECASLDHKYKIVSKRARQQAQDNIEMQQQLDQETARHGVRESLDSGVLPAERPSARHQEKVLKYERELRKLRTTTQRELKENRQLKAKDASALERLKSKDAEITALKKDLNEKQAAARKECEEQKRLLAELRKEVDRKSASEKKLKEKVELQEQNLEANGQTVLLDTIRLLKAAEVKDEAIEKKDLQIAALQKECMKDAAAAKRLKETNMKLRRGIDEAGIDAKALLEANGAKSSLAKSAPRESGTDLKALSDELAKTRKDNRTLAGLVERSRKLDAARQREIKVMQGVIEKVKGEREEAQRTLAKRDREVAGYLTTVKKLKHALRQLSKGEKHLKQARGVMSPIQRSQQFPGVSQANFTSAIPAPPAGGKPKRGGRAGVLSVGGETETPTHSDNDQHPFTSPVTTKSEAQFPIEETEHPESSSPDAALVPPPLADASNTIGAQSVMSGSYSLDDFEGFDEDTTAS